MINETNNKKCKKCIHSNICANNNIIETKIALNTILNCEDYEPENLYLKLPCPVDSPIWRIDFRWGCDTQHCPFEYGDCTSCPYGKNKSKVVPAKYSVGTVLGYTIFLTKEEAEETLARMSDEDIKEYC